MADKKKTYYYNPYGSCRPWIKTKKKIELDMYLKAFCTIDDDFLRIKKLFKSLYLIFYCHYKRYTLGIFKARINKMK